MYYQDASAAVIVFDLGDIETFKDATRWMQELKEFLNKKIPIALAGNKADLPERVVSTEEVEEFIRQNDAKFFYTSAKTGENAKELFEYLAEEAHKSDPVKKPAGIKITQQKKKNNKKCC
eukprot:TRINITY_DN11376_c0_g1_i11.p1 TRINITY_DN11376_c0_g1~~TRINITY_DN11376_c0_g1_i11.p1  ORF type:complete len:120 (+),score=51.23 TRINITY_DN11376_c0_g1_i11:459-818(+)